MTTRLNRIVTIEKPTISRDRFGSELVTWKPFAEVWASRRSTGGDERYRQESKREQALRRAVFTIRYRDDVYEVYRLRDEDGLVWAIEGASHFGRQWTELDVAADVSALSIAP